VVRGRLGDFTQHEAAVSLWPRVDETKNPGRPTDCTVQLTVQSSCTPYIGCKELPSRHGLLAADPGMVCLIMPFLGTQQAHHTAPAPTHAPSLRSPPSMGVLQKPSRSRIERETQAGGILYSTFVAFPRACPVQDGVDHVTCFSARPPSPQTQPGRASSSSGGGEQRTAASSQQRAFPRATGPRGYNIQSHVHNANACGVIMPI
jgi:hypothetical protein